MKVSLIVAASENNVIGRDGGLPWSLPDDLKFFKEKTVRHPIIMGRKTFEALPHGALPDRENIVVTHDRSYSAPGCEIAPSLTEAVMFARRNGDFEEVFIIGGGEIYKQAMEVANVIYLTRVHCEIEGDTFFPEIDTSVWEEVSSTEHAEDDKHAFSFTFKTYRRRSQLHFEN